MACGLDFEGFPTLRVRFWCHYEKDCNEYLGENEGDPRFGDGIVFGYCPNRYINPPTDTLTFFPKVFTTGRI